MTKRKAIRPFRLGDCMISVDDIPGRVFLYQDQSGFGFQYLGVDLKHATRWYDTKGECWYNVASVNWNYKWRII